MYLKKGFAPVELATERDRLAHDKRAQVFAGINAIVTDLRRFIAAQRTEIQDQAARVDDLARRHNVPRIRRRSMGSKLT